MGGFSKLLSSSWLPHMESGLDDMPFYQPPRTTSACQCRLPFRRCFLLCVAAIKPRASRSWMASLWWIKPRVCPRQVKFRRLDPSHPAHGPCPHTGRWEFACHHHGIRCRTQPGQLIYSPCAGWPLLISQCRSQHQPAHAPTRTSVLPRSLVVVAHHCIAFGRCQHTNARTR